MKLESSPESVSQLIETVLKNLEAMDLKARLERLRAAGILDESGRLDAFYRIPTEDKEQPAPAR